MQINRRAFWETVIAAATVAASAEPTTAADSFAGSVFHGNTGAPFGAAPDEKPDVGIHTVNGVTFFVLNIDEHVSHHQSAQMLEGWAAAFRAQGAEPPILLILDLGMRLSKAEISKDGDGPTQVHLHTEVVRPTDPKELAKAIVDEIRKAGVINI